MSSINNFEFVLPTKIIFGEGTINQLPDAVRNMGHEKPLIVTDKGLIAAGLVSKITDVLDDAGIEYAIFDGIQPNPRDTTVQEAAAFAEENAIDMMIAIGGGSSMDTAKAIGVILKEGGIINDYEGLERGIKTYNRSHSYPYHSGHRKRSHVLVRDNRHEETFQDECGKPADSSEAGHRGS